MGLRGLLTFSGTLPSSRLVIPLDERHSSVIKDAAQQRVRTGGFEGE